MSGLAESVPLPAFRSASSVALLSTQNIRKVPMTFRTVQLLVALCFCLAATGCSSRQKCDPQGQPGRLVNEMSNVALLTPKKDKGPVVITTTKGKENVTHCTLAMVKPAEGPVNSDFGVRRAPGKRAAEKFHKGIDIGAKRGSDVVAAASGKVVFTGKKRGYGNTVEIEHGNGVTTRYAHLDRILVSEGQSVDQATRIGLVGRSGHTTGANLHFELIALGKPINPIPQEGWVDESAAGLHRL